MSVRVRTIAAVAASISACSGCSSRAPEPPRAPIVAAAVTPPDAGLVAPDAGVVTPDSPATKPAPPAVTLTVESYIFVAPGPLPALPEVGAYRELGTPRIVRIAVQVSGGPAAIVFANHGRHAGTVWKDGNGGEFEVELVVLDNFVAMRDAFAAGSVDIGWAPVDGLPLLVASGLGKDPRTLPRVFQQLDWSRGADGVVARDSIHSIADLRGKTIAVAPNGPSQYLLLSLLHDAGLQPSDVTMKLIDSPFAAAAAFHDSSAIDACVSWSPDIYNLTQRGSPDKLLVSTQIASRALADVWFARADFASDHPEIIDGLVRGVFAAQAALASADNRAAVGPLLDELFGLDAGTGKDMLGDFSPTSFADNRAFFLDRDNPAGFARIYDDAVRLYKANGATGATVAADKLVARAALDKLAKDKLFAAQTTSDVYPFTPIRADQLGGDALLTRRLEIAFAPGSFDLAKVSDKDLDVKLAEVGALIARFGSARIEIADHSDASMRGQTDESVALELSSHRAGAVRDALVKRFHFDPKQLVARGYGWSVPADATDPDNHAKNRRIEIRVFPAEAL